MRTLIMGALLAGLAAGNAQAQPVKPTIICLL